MLKSLKLRFDEKVVVTPGCWLWVGSIDTSGYGQLWNAGGTRIAHKLSYEFYKGEVLNGLQVLHTCDIPCCVNPDHLFLGTLQDNMRDRDAKGRGKIPDNRGERCGTSKLTEVQVLAIRVDTRPQPQIAKEYRVSKSTISHIKNNKRWKHL